MTPTADHPQITYNKALKQALDNYQAFEKLLPELLKTDENGFVLLHNRQKQGISFGSWEDALAFGRRRFGDGRFSIQKVAALGRDCDCGPHGDFNTGVVALAV